MSVKNLYDREAKDKLRELAESIQITMMATDLEANPFHAIPMTTKKVDDEGNIWFLSGKNSKHNAYIEKEGKAQLLYSKPASFEFMNVYGEATITTDKHVIENLYNKADDNWFDGTNDPNITAIKVQPKEAQYWDTKYSKVVALFKIGVGTITGNKPDLGEVGQMKL